MFQTVRVEKIKTHVLCSIKFFFSKILSFMRSCEKKSSTASCRATDDNTVLRMRIACCITKATDTHSEYIILAVLSRQQWLCERASILRLFIYCLCCCYPWTNLFCGLPLLSLILEPHWYFTKPFQKRNFCSLCNVAVTVSVLLPSVGRITVKLWMGKDLERSGEAQGGLCSRFPGDTEDSGAHLSQNICRLG